MFCFGLEAWFSFIILRGKSGKFNLNEVALMKISISEYKKLYPKVKFMLDRSWLFYFIFSNFGTKF